MTNVYLYVATVETPCPRGGSSTYQTLAHGTLADCYSKARAESFLRDHWADEPQALLDIHLTEFASFAGASKAFAERCGLPEYHKVRRLHLRY